MKLIQNQQAVSSLNRKNLSKSPKNDTASPRTKIQKLMSKD